MAKINYLFLKANHGNFEGAKFIMKDCVVLKDGIEGRLLVSDRGSGGLALIKKGEKLYLSPQYYDVIEINLEQVEVFKVLYGSN